MSATPPNPTFRVSHVSPVDTRSHSRARVLREGGSTFNLSLPMLYEIDDWALRQSPQVSRAEAISRLLRRGLAS